MFETVTEQTQLESRAINFLTPGGRNSLKTELELH